MTTDHFGDAEDPLLPPDGKSMEEYVRERRAAYAPEAVQQRPEEDPPRLPGESSVAHIARVALERARARED